VTTVSPRLRKRIDDLAGRYGLAADAAPRLAALLALVVGDHLAPTAVRESQRVLDDHLADSLVALELEPVRAASVVADLGAGAGFPGLPLAIARPDAHVRLVESNARKCAFISRAITVCGLPNAEVVNARAEAWPDGVGGSDLITARALAPLDVVAEYAAPLLRVGGTLVVWRGRRDAAAEAAAQRAAAELGLALEPPRAVTPYAGADHRYLHVMSKVSPTPGRFPRRPGVAQKRPLGRRSRSSDREHR
jgi:16S rRNA (guanine527-N7)-methyltransferase